MLYYECGKHELRGDGPSCPICHPPMPAYMHRRLITCVGIHRHSGRFGSYEHDYDFRDIDGSGPDLSLHINNSGCTFHIDKQYLLDLTEK